VTVTAGGGSDRDRELPPQQQPEQQPGEQQQRGGGCHPIPAPGAAPEPNPSTSPSPSPLPSPSPSLRRSLKPNPSPSLNPTPPRPQPQRRAKLQHLFLGLLSSGALCAGYGAGYAEGDQGTRWETAWQRRPRRNLELRRGMLPLSLWGLPPEGRLMVHRGQGRGATRGVGGEADPGQAGGVRRWGSGRRVAL